MGLVTLQVPIETKSKCEKLSSNMKAAPEIPRDLDSYAHPQWIVIKNKSQFSISPDGTYFYSGCLHGESSDVGPFDVTAFGARNQKWAGTTGGARFKIKLDQNNEIVFVIGFSDPLVGYYASHIEESWDIENNGYGKVQPDGNKIESIHTYQGTSANGTPLKFRMTLYITSGKTPTVTVVQGVWEEE